MRASSARSGPIANGISVDDDQEEQHADAGAAADPDREPHVAQEEGGERGHGRAPLARRSVTSPLAGRRREASRGSRTRAAPARLRLPTLPHKGEVHRAARLMATPLIPRPPAAARFGRSSPIGPCAAATIRPPPARWSRISSASRSCAVAVERRGRLVEQPDRPLDGEQPGDRQPPPLAGREVGGRQVGQRRRGRPPPAPPPRRARRRRDSASRSRGFRRPRAMASARPGGRDSGPARAGSARGRRPSSSSRPPAARTRPAIMRSSEDLPAPLRPVTTSASPPATENPSPAKTSRPPRTQARSVARKPHQAAADAVAAWPP